MANQPPPIDPHLDPYGYLGLTRNPDGSVARQFEFPIVPASTDPSNPVLIKDITVNQSKGTYVRIYLPRKALDSPEITKLPLIVDFHGGGFLLCRAASAFFYGFQTTVAAEIPAVIASVDYRLAPENRLPAAYEDCTEALLWLKSTNEEWLIKYADFSRCFLMGNSAGGNIAYHLALRVSPCVDDLKPLIIKGLILHHPFFGGTKRTLSEIRLINDKILPTCVSDIMWELSLPIGVDRDHEYCNPMVEIKADALDRIKRLGWKILVTGYHGDPLIDRQIEFAKMLEERGLEVHKWFNDGGCHGVEILEPEKAKGFCEVIKKEIL